MPNTIDLNRAQEAAEQRVERAKREVEKSRAAAAQADANLQGAIELRDAVNRVMRDAILLDRAEDGYDRA